MRITKEQQNILDELVCERLKDNPENSALIQDFENEKGVLIVDYLKQYGLKEDSEGNTAFYIVKTKSKEILMFFSLKCETDVEMGTNKPFYDFACAFMCQRLSELKENATAYFNNFNIDQTDDIV